MPIVVTVMIALGLAITATGVFLIGLNQTTA